MTDRQIIRRCIERELGNGSPGGLVIQTTQENWDKYCSPVDFMVERESIPEISFLFIGQRLSDVDVWLDNNYFKLIDIDPITGRAVLIIGVH